MVDLEGIMLSEKSSRERQILPESQKIKRERVITYMWNLKKAKFIEAASRVLIPMGWGLGETGRCW